MLEKDLSLSRDSIIHSSEDSFVLPQDNVLMEKNRLDDLMAIHDDKQRAKRKDKNDLLIDDLSIKSTKKTSARKSGVDLDEVPAFRHSNISDAKRIITTGENKKWHASTEMQNVQLALDELEDVLSKKALYPCDDNEFEDNLKDIKHAYEKLKSYCSIYLENSNPWFDKGKRRYKAVKDAAFQANAESELLEHTARKIRKAAVKRNDDNDITFADITDKFSVPRQTDQKVTGQLFEKDENSMTRVTASRVYDLLGASDMIFTAESKAVYHKGINKLAVQIMDIEGVSMTKEQIVKNYPGKKVVLSPEAQSQFNTIKLVNMLMGRKTTDKDVKCAFEAKGNTIEISRVVADNQGYRSAQAKDLRTNIHEFFNEIKDAGAAINIDVLNEIISMTAREFSERFGDVLKKEQREELAERIRIIRSEVAETGLDEALGLFKRNSTSDIVVAKASEKGLRELAVEKRRIRKKNKYVTMVEDFRNRLLQNNVRLSDEDPLSQLLEMVALYARMDTTSIGRLAKKSANSLEEEEKLVKRIRRKAQNLVNSYNATGVAQNDVRRYCLNKIYSKFNEKVNGTLEPIPQGARFINHSGTQVGDEPEFSVDTHGVWVSRGNDPLFPHEPCVNDTRQGDIGDCFFVGAVAAVVSSCPGFIRKIMKDNGDSTVTVRLYTYENGQFSPIYVKVNKTVPRYNNRRDDLYAKDCLWLQMLEKAFVCSGLLSRFKAMTNRELFGIQNDNDPAKPLDYSDPDFRQRVGNLTTTMVNEQGNNVSNGRYQAIEGGFGELVVPLITGNALNETQILEYDMYFNDYAYSGLNRVQRNEWDRRAKFSTLTYWEAETERVLREKMRTDDKLIYDNNKKADEKKRRKRELARKKKLGIKEDNEEQKEQKDDKKKDEQPEVAINYRNNISAATDYEKNYAIYFQFTGKVPGKDVKSKRVNTVAGFAKACLNYMDRNVRLSDKDINPYEQYLKLMNKFLREYPNTLEEDKKADYLLFRGTDEFKTVRKYIRNNLKKADDTYIARYTLYSGNYYGKALEVFNRIKAGEQNNEVMVVGGNKRLLGAKSLKNNDDQSAQEGNAKGLYSLHQYSVHGVREKKFGGKTYKFVLVRNPWGQRGTEYFYDPKKKSLSRRFAEKETKTEGYTLVELSDFMMGFEQLYVGGKPAED